MSLILSKEWLKAAYLDLENISYIIKAEHLTSIVAFHSQQSIEKSLKAFITSKNIDIPKIHSLNKLFNICKEDVSINNNDLINLLDSLYIESRYPGDMGLLPYGKPTLKDAKEFYDFAENIFEHICSILNIPIYEIKTN
ncbi:MAG: HEPN domain-containing protein [Sulfurimonas sp.]|jgi:HEPN domain-containing protein